MAYDELQELFEEAETRSDVEPAAPEPADMDQPVPATDSDDIDSNVVTPEPADVDQPIPATDSDDVDFEHAVSEDSTRVGQLLPYNETNSQQANLIFRLRSIVNEVEALHMDGDLLDSEKTAQLGLAIRVLTDAVDPKIRLSRDFNDAINYAGLKVSRRAETDADSELEAAKMLAVHLVDGLHKAGCLDLTTSIERQCITAKSGASEAKLLFGEMYRIDRRDEYAGVDVLALVIALRGRKQQGRPKGVKKEDYVPWPSVRSAYFKTHGLCHDERTLRE